MESFKQAGAFAGLFEQSFAAKLDEFLALVVEKDNAYMTRVFPTLPLASFKTEPGKRYVRIVRTDGFGAGRGSYAFVDSTNGDVLKAASWKAPAKHARGNIYAEDGGASALSADGANIRYL